MRRKFTFASAALSLLAVAAGFVACGGPDFDPVSKITSVRVLATRADKPYAKPGDTVTIEALTVDGRADQTPPMHVYWLPFACTNPRSDLYYACFAALSGGSGDAGAFDASSEGGASGGLPSKITSPIDITSFLKEGPSYSVSIPSDIITSHPPVEGAAAPYGLSITFFIACAGRVFLLPPDTTNVSGQFVPVGCGSDPDNLSGPDDYVFSFTRVYAYDDITNQNPVIDGVTFDGQPVDLTQGVVVPRCGSSNESDCEHAIDVHVPDDSWELNPADKDQDGNVRHEQIYASYFYSAGTTKTKSTGRILFDPAQGRITDSANQLIQAPGPESGRLWVVVHDNRDGAAWISFPYYVK